MGDSMSNTNLTTMRTKFYQVIAIAIAVSLLVSFPIYYFYLAPQPARNNNEQSNYNVYRVQGILSLYKNGQLVHQGPDLLTNAFYNYTPFLLGDVCTANSAVTSCPSANWASNVFASPPPALSCSLYYPFNIPAPHGVPIAGNFSPAIYIGVGTGSSTSPTDCLVNTLKLNQSASTYPCDPRNPCRNSIAGGYVQINTTFSITNTITVSEAMLYVAYSYNSSVSKAVYTLIAHDTFPGITLFPGDTLTVIYMFIFPNIPTDPGAYSGVDQGSISTLFAQCLARQYFANGYVQLGDAPYRICIDNKVSTNSNYTNVIVSIPNNPCDDLFPPTTTTDRGNNTISIIVNATSKYVQIKAPMRDAGTGIQIVEYSLGVSNGIYTILLASQSCSVATLKNFSAGDTVGIQLNFP